MVGAVQVLNIVKRVSPQIRAPIVIFLYFNPILYRTIDKMCQQLADSGAKGETNPQLLQDLRYLFTQHWLRGGCNLLSNITG